MPLRPASAHDLVRLHRPSALTAEASMPAWVRAALRQAPWVVVRRGHSRDGLLPVGVRGLTRAQRFGAWLALGEVAERLSPEDLATACSMSECRRSDAAPALAALARVALILARRGCPWGPGGSVGFELATGVPIVTASSDLDVILRQTQPLGLDEARALHTALVAAAAPVRIDALLETPSGGIALAELAAAPMQVLVRTPDGPRLAADPWEGGS